MIKKYWKLFMIPLLALFVVAISTTSTAAEADLRTGSVTLTEEERYNPEYYQPLDHVICSSYSLRANTQMNLESYIIQALQNREETIDLSDYELTVSEVQTKYFQILNNEYQFFYVDNAFYYSYNTDNYVSALYPEYNLDADTTRQIQEQLDDVAAEATSLISEDMKDYEKALVIHDWLVTYCEYDYENLQNGTVPTKSHKLYGALVDKVAVCDGYAKAYQYIMQHKLGIPCYLTSSESMNHAWNIIQIGEHYYHVDATWDDPVSDIIGRALHTNFLLSDTAIQNTPSEGHHDWETALVADDTSYDNGLWQESDGNIIYYDNNWYFIDSDDRALCKTDNIFNGSTEKLETLDKWATAGNSYYSTAFSYPHRYHDKLIYNGPKKIYVMSLKTGEMLQDYTYTPAETNVAGQNIYGLYLDGTTIYYAVQENPYSQTSQKNDIKSTTLQQDEIAGSVLITGDARYNETLTAEVTLDTGISNIVSYTWYRDDVEITGETGSTYKVTREDINKVLSVKVTHKHYTGALTAQTELVQKAVPALPEPNVLKVNGVYGLTLSSIELPDGYVWLHPDTTLSEVKTAEFDALYCPDSEIYESIPQKVSVRTICADHEWDDGEIILPPDCLTAGTCRYICTVCQFSRTETVPATGHLWDDGEVVQKATTTLEGLIEYTCQHCGATSQETIEKLTPSAPPSAPTPGTVNTPEPDSTSTSTPGVVNTSEPGSTNTPTPGVVNTSEPGSTNTSVPGSVNTPKPAGTNTSEPNSTNSTVSGQNTGDTIIIGKLTYQIIQTGSSEAAGTVTVIKAAAASTIVIPANITKDNITYKVVSIAPKALMKQSKMKKLTIGANVQVIGKQAFYGCKKLKTVQILSKQLKSVGKNAIKNIHKKAVIKCPSKKQKAYKKLFGKKTGYLKTMKIK